MKVAALKTPTQKFLLAKFDEISPLIEQLGLNLESVEDRQALQYFETLLVSILSDQASGLLLDPSYGLPNLDQVKGKPGLVLRLDDFIDPAQAKTQVPKLLKDWGVEQVSNNYGVAKFELFYHPQEEKALEKKQLVNEIKDFCDHEGIDLFLIVRIFNPQEAEISTPAHAEAQLEAAQELGRSCQLLGLEYPGSSLFAATLTAELDVPWIMVAHHQTQQEPYETLKARLRESLEEGAQGLAVGQVLWSDLNQFRNEDASFDWEQVKSFLATTARDRLAELKRIIEEAA